MSHLPPDAVEFIGFVASRLTSEIHPPEGPAIDREYLDRLARAHEAGGFDRVLVAVYSTAPDALLIATRIAAVTERIGLMIAHRTGFTAPTMAARQFATLHQLTGGRIAIHAISGGDDRDLARDGDHLTKDQRYARTREFLDISRLSWTAETPFEYAGTFYRIEQGFSEVKPVGAGGIPVFFGGASPAALEIAGRYADTYALWGETSDQVRDLLARGRSLWAQAPLQPIVPADPGRYGRGGLGTGRGDPRADPPNARGQGARPRRNPAERGRAPAPGCGERHPPRQAPLHHDRRRDGGCRQLHGPRRHARSGRRGLSTITISACAPS